MQTSKETDVAGAGRRDNDGVTLCSTSTAEKSQQSQESVEGDEQLYCKGRLNYYMTLQNNLGLPFFWDTNSIDIGVELFEINALKSFLSLSLFILMVNTVWFSSMDNVVTCPKSLKAPMASCVQWRKTYRKSSI